MFTQVFIKLSVIVVGISSLFITLFHWNDIRGKVHADITTTASDAATLTVSPTVDTLSPTVTPEPTGNATPSAVVNNASHNPFSGMTLYNDADTNSAVKQVQDWQNSRPADASLLQKIADQPKAIWLGNWNANVQSDVQKIMAKATATNSMPVFIAYNIPGRDCGNYSAGGAGNDQAYRDWIDGITTGIGSGHAAVILEPDALAQDCLQGTAKQQRYDLLKYAVQKLKALGNTAVYLDAGHAGWINENEMAQRLTAADIQDADGFALNISNFDTTSASITYGEQIAKQINNKHFVIDTSRNGKGPTADNQWCNPSGRALGEKPTAVTNNSLVDAFLWLKYPGESDGNCNGGPNAGQWFADYALELAKNSTW